MSPEQGSREAGRQSSQEVETCRGCHHPVFFKQGVPVDGGKCQLVFGYQNRGFWPLLQVVVLWATLGWAGLGGAGLPWALGAVSSPTCDFVSSSSCCLPTLAL